MNSMSYTTSHKKVVIDGPLNSVSCFYMHDVLMKQSFKQDITLDCTNLTMIDGTGLGLLVELYMELKDNKHKLFLHNLTGQPLSLIKTLGLLSYFKEEKQCQHQYELQKGY